MHVRLGGGLRCMELNRENEKEKAPQYFIQDKLSALDWQPIRSTS
jgi:hypothetical protein